MPGKCGAPRYQPALLCRVLFDAAAKLLVPFRTHNGDTSRRISTVPLPFFATVACAADWPTLMAGGGQHTAALEFSAGLSRLSVMAWVKEMAEGKPIHHCRCYIATAGWACLATG